MTSEGNLEIARRAFTAAFAQPPDLESLRQVCDAAVLTTSDWGMEETERHGLDGLLDGIAEMAAAFDPWHQDLERLIDAGEDCVVGFLHLRAQGRESGVPVEFRWALLVTIDDGRIMAARAFVDRDEALRAAGLAD